MVYEKVNAQRTKTSRLRSQNYSWTIWPSQSQGGMPTSRRVSPMVTKRLQGEIINMTPKSKKIMEALAQGRENNIIISNIKNNRIIEILNTKNQNKFAQESVMADALTSSSSSGKADEENDSSQVNPRPPKIVYMSVSLMATKTTRQRINVDFRLDTTPANEFNKLVFSLTDRKREFLDNVPQQYHNDWEYQQALEHWVMSTTDERWIGKGRPRRTFQAGQKYQSKLQLGLSCVMEKTRQGYAVNLWIEGTHHQCELAKTGNSMYPYRYSSDDALTAPDILPRGGWR